MCQVHTGAYVSLLVPRKTDYTACHPKDYHVNITRSIYHYAYARQTQVNWKKETKKKKEERKREESEKKKLKRKGKKGKDKKSKKRQDKKRKQGKEEGKKMSY